MANTIILSVRDEDFSGKLLQEISIGLSVERISVKDIIEARVRQEVENYNNKQPEYYNGLIEPTDAEKTVNGYRLKKKKVIDAEQQVYIALNAFQQNRFFILVDDQQCDSLDQQIKLDADKKISFVKLTPLVGG